MPQEGDACADRTADDPVVFPSFKERAKLRPYAFIFRLSVLVALVLTSAFMAGWKWGSKG
jgi:hypothetical protein